MGDPKQVARLQRCLSILQVVVVAIAIAVIAPVAAGYRWRTVATGSMRPLIQPGDVVLVAPTSDLPDIGDVIVFHDPLKQGTDVVHRVYGFEKNGAIITKGDANDVADPWELSPSAIVGDQVLTLPKIGSLVEWLGSKPGILVFLVLPALAILISESRVWYRYVRFGRQAFIEPGRHLPLRGRHMERVPA